MLPSFSVFGSVLLVAILETYDEQALSGQLKPYPTTQSVHSSKIRNKTLSRSVRRRTLRKRKNSLLFPICLSALSPRVAPRCALCMLAYGLIRFFSPEAAHVVKHSQRHSDKSDDRLRNNDNKYRRSVRDVCRAHAFKRSYNADVQDLPRRDFEGNNDAREDMPVLLSADDVRCRIEAVCINAALAGEVVLRGRS